MRTFHLRYWLNYRYSYAYITLELLQSRYRMRFKPSVFVLLYYGNYYGGGFFAFYRGIIFKIS